MQSKDVIVALIKDVIKAYRVQVNQVSVQREKQIQKILMVCETVQYDTVVMHHLRCLILDLKLSSEGFFRWIYAPRSRLEAALSQVLLSYEQSILIKEKQQIARKTETTYNYKQGCFKPEREAMLMDISSLHKEMQALKTNGAVSGLLAIE